MSFQSAFAMASLVPLLLNGCAYIDPFVSVKATEHQAGISANLPQMTLTARYLDDRIQEVEAKGLQFGREHRRLDVLTFGLATAAAFAPVYKAHRDLIAGLSMGAAATYSGNALFSPASMGELYGSAVVSLACIRGKASILSAEVSKAVADDGSDRLAADYEALACASPESQDAIGAAYDNAVSLAQRAVRSDSLAAAKLRQAGISVVSALNREIGLRAPSSEAILAAARATSAGVASAASTATSPSTTKMMAFSAATCDDRAEAAAEARKDKITAEFTNIAEGLRAALDAIEGLDKSCPLTVAQIADIALDRDTVTVAVDSEIYVRVSGGRPPYRSTWESDPRGNGVSRTDIPDFVIVRGAAKIAADGTYKLTIMDSSAVARTKVLTVTAKKGGGS